MTINYINHFNEYKKGYLDDIICEIADYCSPIYTYDCYEYLREHMESAEEVVNSGLYSPKEGSFSLQDLGAVTAWYDINNELCNNLYDYLYASICHHNHLDSLSPEQEAHLRDCLDFYAKLEEFLEEDPMFTR